MCGILEKQLNFENKVSKKVWGKNAQYDAPAVLGSYLRTPESTVVTKPAPHYGKKQVAKSSINTPYNTSSGLQIGQQS